MRRIINLLAVLALSSLIALPVHAGDRIPLEHFARLPAFSDPRISPDGLRMASTIIVKGKPLVVVQPIPSNGKTLKEKPAALSVGDKYVSDYVWVSNDRLILTIRDSIRDGSGAFGGQLLNVHRLLSVRRDAKDHVNFHMSTSFLAVWEIYKPNPKLVSPLLDDPDSALVILDDEDGKWYKPIVHKVDVNTGKRTRVSGNYAGVEDYMGDHQGNIRLGFNVGFRNTDWIIYHRKDNNSAWEEIQRVDYFDREVIDPVRISDEDPNIAIVRLPNSLEVPDEEDHRAGRLPQYAYDLTSKQIVGRYVDEKWERVKSMVERRFPEVVVSEESHTLDKSAYIVKTQSDVSPPRYFLVDLKNMGIVRLGRSYPKLEGVELAKMETVEYRARDGRVIPAFLTRPANAAPGVQLPTVIYPHGGPFARDYWGFDNYVQFLASRGYAVLQPQYRGSTGYGAEHMEAGYREYGLAIQDDITDGVQWLIDEGISAPDRICIMGGSYGGYAALMGLIKTPELYQCAISINGVANRLTQNAGNLVAAVNRKRLNEGRELHKVSPFHVAESITDPVLLLAGTKDTVVNYEQSKTLYEKLKKLGRAPVKYVELEDAEHWRTSEAAELKVFREMDKFLQKHLQ